MKKLFTSQPTAEIVQVELWTPASDEEATAQVVIDVQDDEIKITVTRLDESYAGPVAVTVH